MSAKPALAALAVLGLVVALLHPAYVDLPAPIRVASNAASTDSSNGIEDQEEAPAAPEDDLDPAPTWAGVGQARPGRLSVQTGSGWPDPDFTAAAAMSPVRVLLGDLRARARARWSKTEPTIRLCRLLC